VIWSRREFLKNALTTGVSCWVGTYAAAASLAHSDETSSLPDRVGREAERTIENARHTNQYKAFIGVGLLPR
jgi:hypothetical protein